MRKGSKLSKKSRSREVKVDVKATRTLRTLSNEEAFHFYETIGKPTGQSAKSLHEFLDKIESAKLESLVFHLERNDFKNWIANALEDPKLAQKIEMLPIEHNSQLRTKIRTTIKARLKELEGTSVQVHEPVLASL